MRVLLDEHLDRRLEPLFERRYQVLTVHERGWGGRKNGELLRLAAAEFEVLVTMDGSLEHQQNLRKIGLSIVILHAHSNRR
jgi:predicted nuclease of predicted toxin-antitoxin system